MKFLHSPSSSSSTSEFPTTSCIPAALRRLLCFHSLHTLPFDHHIEESYGDNEIDELYCANKLKGNPGIVAKLMGLDSMPTRNSVNQCNELRKKGGNVREAPTFVELENDKFIILSFEGGGKDKELKLKSSKTRKGSNEFQEKTSNTKNQEMPICQTPENDAEVKNSCKLFDSKSGFEKNSTKLCDTECAKGGRLRNKILEKVETESDSENSSPVSVLEFPYDQEASHSGKEDSTLKKPNSRRKLKGDLDQNAPSPSPRSSCNSTDEGVESNKNGKRCVGLKKNLMIGEMWVEICKMAERDVMDLTMERRERWKGEDFEEIGVSFEQQILDQLILEIFTYHMKILI